MQAPLIFPTIRFLKGRGVLQGRVVTTAKTKIAKSVERQNPALLLVYVASAGQQGRYWVMGKEDAERMVAAGYPVIDWADLDNFIPPPPPDW